MLSILLVLVVYWYLLYEYGKVASSFVDESSVTESFLLWENERMEYFHHRSSPFYVRIRLCLALLECQVKFFYIPIIGALSLKIQYIRTNRFRSILNLLTSSSSSATVLY